MCDHIRKAIPWLQSSFGRVKQKSDWVSPVMHVFHMQSTKDLASDT